MKIPNEPKVDIPEVAPGDTVKVSMKVLEGDKERSQILQGVLGIGRGKGFEEQEGKTGVANLSQISV